MTRSIAAVAVMIASFASFGGGGLAFKDVGPGFSPAIAASAADEQFDAAWHRLKQGPKYGVQKTGAFQIRYPFANGVEFENWVDVPADYDPSRPWPLRVQLHGGVS